MPLTAKGEKIEKSMTKQYGAKKGEEVFYASRNKGTITGVDAERKAQDARLARGEYVSGRDRAKCQ